MVSEQESSNQAVAVAKPKKAKPAKKRKPAQLPAFHVILLNDDDHSYDYVIEMLQKIFIFSLEQAYHHAEEVDRAGRTALITCELLEAEFARDQIQSFGRDARLPRSQGSMSAVVEPAG